MRKTGWMFKAVTWALAVSLFHAQYVWAVDVRQMLVEAKASFDEYDEIRRPDAYSPQDLQNAQSQQQSVIDQQNEIEALRFRLTTQNGDLLEYVGDRLDSVTRADGSRLQNIQLNEAGQIVDADLRLGDGSVQIYRGGQVLGYRLPDGRQVVYEGGRVQKVVGADGAETLYTYETDAGGAVTGMVLENSFFRSAYSPEGVIRSLLDKRDGRVSVYDGGILQRVDLPGGSTLVMTRVLAGGELTVALGHLLDAQGNRHYYGSDRLERIELAGGWVLDDLILSSDGATLIDYAVKDGQGNLLSDTGVVTHPGLAPASVVAGAAVAGWVPFEWARHGAADGRLRAVRTREGAELTFDAEGMLAGVTGADGSQSGFVFYQSALSNLVGTEIVRGGVTSTYDAEGRLAAVKVGGVTVHYAPEGGAIEYLESEDGSEWYGLEFDEAGGVASARVYTPDGEERVYQAGKLVSLTRPDYTKIYYFDGKPLQIVTPDLLVYNFTYEGTEITADLDASIVPDALTPVRMRYDEAFSLKQAIRQNQEILSYLGDDLVKIEAPGQAAKEFFYTKDASGAVLSYRVVEGNVETFYDAADQPTRALIHPASQGDPELEILYRYGKIREIRKDGTLTFKYAYEIDGGGQEITRIEDLEEKALKTYCGGRLLSSLSTETSVLSSYEYSGDRVSRVTTSRLGRALHAYEYAYAGDLTLVTDEEGVRRTYDGARKLLYLEREDSKYAYAYYLDPDGKEIVEEELTERRLADGSVVEYDKGVIGRIVRPDGTVLRDVALDGARRVVKATAQLTDGTRLVFDGAQVIEEIAVDGTHYHYDGGLLTKVERPDGQTLDYSYVKDDAGNVLTTVVRQDEVSYEYDSSGELKAVKLHDVPVEVDGAQDFSDAVDPGRAVLHYGNAAITTGGPAVGRGAAFLDGSGDYLALADSEDWNISNGIDFTVDFWLNMTQKAASRDGWIGQSSGGSGWAFYWDNSNNIVFRYTVNGGIEANLTWAWNPSVDTWNHVALVRAGNNWTVYVNGQALGAQQCGKSLMNFSGELWIGRNAWSGDGYLKGSIDALRFTKGQARWTANFTPPVSAEAPDAATKLRLDFDGHDLSRFDVSKQVDAQGAVTGYLLKGDAGTASYDAQFALVSRDLGGLDSVPAKLADVSGLGKTLQASGSLRLRQDAPVGDSAIRFSPGSYLSLADADDWDFGTGDFTVDLWTNFNSLYQGNTLIDIGGHDSGLWIQSGHAGGPDGPSSLEVYVKGDGASYIYWTPTLQRWYHVAVVRQAGTLKFFIDGHQVGAWAGKGYNLSGLARGVRIGASFLTESSSYFDGMMDGVRITKGLARWSGDFTPPVERPAADDATKLLLDFESPTRGLLDGALSGELGARISVRIETPYLGRVTRAETPQRAGWYEAASSSVLSTETVAAQEYSSDGVLETQTKADGTVTLFDDNKPSVVLDAQGNTLIEYAYDAAGNLQSVRLKNARDALPEQIRQAGLRIEEQKQQALLQLAQSRNLAYQSIKEQADAARQQVQPYLDDLGGQLSGLEGQSAHGKSAKKAKSHALDQIREAINQAEEQRNAIYRQESAAYAALDAQAGALAADIEGDAASAYEELARQEEELEREVVRQEVSPVIYDYYRRILGRDPSSAEYGEWIDKVSYEPGTGGETRIQVGEDVSHEWTPVSSTYLDGAGDYLALADSEDWNISNGIDFTVDFWLNMKQKASNRDGWVGQSSGGTGWSLYWDNGNNVIFRYTINGGIETDLTWAWNPSVDTWNHIGLVRSGNTLNLYINGQNLGAKPFGKSMINFAGDLWIGRNAWSGDGYLNGYIDALRFAKGQARWTGNFTPKVQYDAADLAGQLFIRPGAAGGWADLSGRNHGVSGYGDARADADIRKSQTLVETRTPIYQGLTAALDEHLSALPELAQRQAYVRAVKDAVRAQVTGYLAMSQADKLAYAQSLGMAQDEIIALTQADAERVLAWLETRSLHFGQSAFLSLEALLDQKGISYAREDIATRAILVDILAGVITPLDDGDLVLSVYSLNKVASLYGLSLSGAKLDYADLLAVFQANPTARVIAHINGNHYVVVTRATLDSITYMDPGAGPDKQNEIKTIAKSDFLKGWRGDITAETVLVDQVVALSAAKTTPTARALTIEETQKIRGAFFFFLIPAIIGAIQTIGGAVWAVINGIGALISGLGQLVGNALVSLQGALQSIGQGLNYIGGAIFKGISFAASSLGQALGNVGSFLSQTVFGSFAKTGFGSALFENIARTGLNYAFNQGLTALGVDPGVSRYISAFVSGGTVNGFGSLSSFVQQGVMSVAPILGQDLGLQLDLAPNLRAAISIFANGFTDGLASVDLGSGLATVITENLVKAGTFYGITELGGSIGLDSAVSAAFALPVLGGIGRSFDAGRLVGEDIVQSVWDGITGSFVQAGVDFAVDQMGADDPLLNALSSAVLTRTLSSFIDPNGSIVEDVLKSAGEFGQNLLKGVSSTEFVIHATEHGLESALEVYATSIFSRQALEEIHGAGGIAQVISGRSQLVDYNGITMTRVNITGGEGFVLDEDGRLAGMFRTVDDTLEEMLGEFEITAGKARLVNGTVRTESADGEVAYIRVRNGEVRRIAFRMQASEDRGPSLRFEPPINPEIPGYNEHDFREGQEYEPLWDLEIVENYDGALRIDGFDIVDGLIFVGGGISLNVADLFGTSVKFDLGEGQGAAGADRLDHDLYVLTNGILNHKAKSDGSPTYLNNLKQDIIEQSNRQIQDEDIVTASTFFTSPIVNALLQRVASLASNAAGPYREILGRVAGEILVNLYNGSKDALSWLAEVSDPYAASFLVEEIQAALKAYYERYGQGNRDRGIVALGYSGGFVPLVEALRQPGYSVKTWIALGAATIRPEEAAKDLLVKVMEAADRLSDPLTVPAGVLEAALNNLDLSLVGLLGVGIGKELIEQILEFVAQKTPEQAYNAYVGRLGELGEMINQAFDGSALDELTTSGAQMVVNVYGTKDILSQLKINGVSVGGYRGEIGGYTATNRDRALINIEIVGATHHDYMRMDPPGGLISGLDYLKADHEWNEAVSVFVADITGHSDSEANLTGYLRSDAIALKHNVVIKEQLDRWIIELPGHDER